MRERGNQTTVVDTTALVTDQVLAVIRAGFGGSSSAAALHL